MSNRESHYHDYANPDPPHQPLYLKLVLGHLSAPRGIKNVLDAGCGDGNFAESLAQAGYSVFGIDLSEGGIARATERKAPQALFRVGSVYDDFRELFSECREFDAVVSIEVIEHLHKPRAFIRRAYEGLRTGGLLIITTPYWGYLKNVVLAVSGRMDRALTALWDGGHIKHWSYRTLRTLVEERAFEFVAFRGAGRRIPFLWNGMLMVFRKKASQLAGS
jgi:2-polyprenyl-6-hydroxyphenyl methylase/3-demethylubiquinone-9 3-methyltransferase